jgi:hypothetical protein
MPVQFKQVISSFLTQFAYIKFAVSAAWHVLPGFDVLMFGSEAFNIDSLFLNL